MKLFMAIGGLEGIDRAFGKFVKSLTSRHYQGLVMETRVLEGMGHSGGKLEGFARGLQYVYARPSKQIGTSALDGFAGRYRFNPLLAVSILKENCHLDLLTPDSTKMDLHAESDSLFYMKGSYLYITFRKNAAGVVTGLHAEQFQGGFDLKRED